ncbi:MAG: membrane protein insertion efficiency factor YidD [Planctomycetaceae bacterium]
MATDHRWALPKAIASSPWRRAAGVLLKLPANGLILLVRAYQIVLGPLLGGQCRFHPSCSEYFIGAVEKYGAISGATRGIWRILRCHPWHPGGYDPP